MLQVYTNDLWRFPITAFRPKTLSAHPKLTEKFLPSLSRKKYSATPSKSARVPPASKTR